MTNEQQGGGDALDEAERAAAEEMGMSDPPVNVTPIGGDAPSGEGEPPSDGSGDGEQPSYLPPTVPEGFILAPSDSTFANATWLRAGPEIRELVAEVLEMKGEDTDFRALALMDWEVCWRRATAPQHNGEPNYAGVWVPDPRVEWEVLRHGVEDFARFVVDIHWKHFADLADDDQPAAVHRDYVRRDIHYALARLTVDNDRISTRPPILLLPANVREFGAHGDGARMIKREFDNWPELLGE